MTENAPLGSCYDEFEVVLPDGWTTYKNQMDDTIIVSPNGRDKYFVHDIFFPGQKPIMKYGLYGNTAKVEYCQVNDTMLYKPEYL